MKSQTSIVWREAVIEIILTPFHELEESHPDGGCGASFRCLCLDLCGTLADLTVQIYENWKINIPTKIFFLISFCWWFCSQTWLVPLMPSPSNAGVFCVGLRKKDGRICPIDIGDVFRDSALVGPMQLWLC